MGKVRVKTFDESANEDLEAKKKAKREAKKAEKKAQKSEEAKAAISTPEEKKTPEKKDQSPTTDQNITVQEKTTPEASAKSEASTTDSKKSKKGKFATKKDVSDRVQANKKLVSKTQTYSLEKAVSLLQEFKKSKFDETVELHLNVREKGISGDLKLPHGTGKQLKITIADDSVISAIETGKIDFDVLVATPDMMPKLARVARVLGPRGLMPNPKNGTISQNPEEVVKKLSGGEIRFKTEGKAPIIHLIIGKMSFGDEKILENAKTAINTVGQNKIKSAVLTSTMSPGIKLNLANN